MTSASSGPDAPLDDAEPTSSWSNSATTATWAPVRRRSTPTSLPSTTPGCRAGRWRSTSGRRRARRRAGGRRGTVPRTPARRPARSPIQAAKLSPRASRLGGPHRTKVHVPVEDEATVVDLSIEMDRQLRDTGDWLVDVHQRRRAVGGDDAAGDAEVAIEPAVQQRAAVHLDAEQPPIGDGLVSMGMNAQPRRVGVCTDDAQTVRTCRRTDARPRVHLRAG